MNEEKEERKKDIQEKEEDSFKKHSGTSEIVQRVSKVNNSIHQERQ